MTLNAPSLHINPPRDEWTTLTRRNIPADDAAVTEAVEAIVADVATRGDAALIEYAKKFDGVDLTSLRVGDSEIEQACDSLSAELKQAIVVAADNIRRFHTLQLPQPVECVTTEGVRCIQRGVPIDKVGLYVPGGRAPLFSTVLMLALPAMIAGCRRVALFTPRSREFGIHPAILFAAHHCGVKEIYQVGGAQAIAAMTYGTESIQRVDKIFGPGNRFVTKAKQLVSTRVAIDMPAGPSEVMVLADFTANPAFVAADMLSQAEHGPDSQAIAVCQSPELAKRVIDCVMTQARQLTRIESVASSLAKSRVIVLDDRQTMIDFANAYAAEHLIISVDDPWAMADEVKAAGSVFIGNYSPESAGDYASGTNHTLPTSGWATSMSGVNIDSYMHKITYQQLTRQGLASLADTITTMAHAEGLDAHAAAIDVRLKTI